MYGHFAWFHILYFMHKQWKNDKTNKDRRGKKKLRDKGESGKRWLLKNSIIFLYMKKKLLNHNFSYYFMLLNIAEADSLLVQP